MNIINILRKLQTLLEKEELLFTDICKEWKVTDSQEEFLNILEHWKWPIHGSVKRKTILRNFKLRRKTSESILHLGTSYILLKVSKKNWSCLDWGKKRKTQGKKKDIRREIIKEGRKEAVKTNVRHNGLLDTKKK